MVLVRGTLALVLLLPAGVAGCASGGTQPPSVTAEEPVPARFVEVQALFPDGARADNAVVGLQVLGPQGYYRTVEKRTVAATLQFPLPGAGRYRVAALDSPGVFEGWMHWGETRDPHVEFEAGVEESEGRRIRLVVPRPGDLDVVVREPPEAAGKPSWVSLRRRRADGSLVPYHAQPKVEVDHPEGPGGPAVHRFRGLPEGSWRLRFFSRGSACQWRDIEVAAGSVTIVVLEPGPGPAAREVSYEGPPSRNGRGISYNLNPVDSGNPAVAFGLISEPGHRATLEGASPGRYFLLLWEQGLDLRLDLAADSPGPIPISAPPDFASGGRSHLRVRMVRRGERVEGPLVALAPKKGRAPAAGDWFRFTQRTGTGWFEFEGLPRGEYEVFLFDGVLGATLGLGPYPVVRPVRLGERDAVDLEVDLGDLTPG